MLKRTTFYSCLAIIFLSVSTAHADSPYVAPDLKVKLFNGDLAIDQAQRQKVAIALAGLARNLPFNQKVDYQTASRLLGLALTLDPDCKEALIVNGDLEDDRIPKHQDKFSTDDTLKQLHAIAASTKDSKNKPDQTLAAYLYSAMNSVSLNDDDTYQLQILKRAGIKANWKWGTDRAAYHNGHDEPVPEIKDITKVNTLVITSGPDGNWHGKVSPLVAAKSGRTGFFGKPDMVGVDSFDNGLRASFGNAVRAANIHHPGVGKAPIEVSFQEKYTIKEGGSAGAAFTLLILSACGDFELNTNTAIIGDIGIDGKIESVGMVAEKIHGATVDHTALVAIPASDTSGVEDTILLRGPAALGEIQIFGVDTLDDAIAMMRANPAPKLAQAMAAFDKLKPQLVHSTIESLTANQSLKKSLEEILALAPNHLSAKYLLSLANGVKPACLSLMTSATEAFAAIGPMRTGLTDYDQRVEVGTDENAAIAHKNLTRIQAIADPAAKPLFTALFDYSATYAQWGNAHRRDDIGLGLQLDNVMGQNRLIVRTALAKVITDRAAYDLLTSRYR